MIDGHGNELNIIIGRVHLAADTRTWVIVCVRRYTYTQAGLLQCGFTHNTQGPRPHVQTSDKRLAIEASHPGRLELGVQSRVRERMYYTVQVEHIIRCTVQIHCIRVYYFLREIRPCLDLYP